MNTTTITGAEILTPDGLLPSTITIADGIVQSITGTGTGSGPDSGPGQTVPDQKVEVAGIDTGSDSALAEGAVIDGTGLIVSAGFLDLQINGGFGIDLASQPEAMWELGRELPQHGVTSFLPTIITGKADARAAARRALKQRPTGYRGAEPLGLHFEGPMISPQRAGAHPVRHIVAPSLETIEDWSADDGVALVTIAPELDNADHVITELVKRGVTVSAGHTTATADDARAGMTAGVTMVTHLFNAMAPLGHRDPNLIGVALATKGLTIGLIVDGVHVDPTVVAATWNAKGKGDVALVTDAVAPMGQGPGRYDFSGSVITADHRCVRNDAGTLAGSILTMDQAVRNLIAYTGCQTGDALHAASATPAAVIGRSDRGQLRPGATADLALLDQDLRVRLTFCAGEVAYRAEDIRVDQPQDPTGPS